MLIRFFWLSGFLLAGFICHPTGVQANDSSAELGVGGLVLARSDDIRMVFEDLYISRSKVSVDYTFRNETDHDIRTIVAFPLPELPAASVDFSPSIPFYDRGANFVGFKTLVDDTPVKIKVELRALAAGIDRSDLLKAHGIPLAHYTEHAAEKLKVLPADVVAEFEKLGLVRTMNAVEPAWTQKVTFYWEQMFSAKKDLKISHEYTPVAGSFAGTVVGIEFAKEALADHRTKYCLDAAFEAAIKKVHAANVPLAEFWVEYILKTGANWAGDIARFRLVVDKGAKSNFVSFCADGVTKISPTHFEMVKENFYPQDNLQILFIESLPVEN